MLKHVTLGLNTVQPETWTRHDVEDLCAFLQEQFGAQFPDTARIYHGSVDLPNDVTPGNQQDIETLQSLPGPFYVMVYPGWAALPYIVGLVLAVASYLLAPSPTAAPIIAQRNTTATSPNNDLSDRANKARPNARIPDIYGTVRSTPDLIAAPYKIFENNREVEYAEMCVGRGAYEILEENINDSETDVRDIPGATVEIYAPYTSWNNSDPELRIGTLITRPILNSIRSNSVNGQVLRPPNSASFIANGNVRFIWPNIVELDGGDPRDWTKSFVEGDVVTITDADLAGGTNTLITSSGVATGPVGTTGDVRTGIQVNLTSISNEPPTIPSYYEPGEVIILTDVSATTYPGNAMYDHADLSGTYTIQSSEVVYKYPDTNYGYYYIDVQLSGAESVNANWNTIPYYGKAAVFEIALDNAVISGFDLNGDYTILNVTEKTLILSNPSAVAADWDLLETQGPTPFISPTIVTAEGPKWVGPYIMAASDLTGAFANFVAPNGLYKDNGTDQYAEYIGCQLEVTPVDSNDDPIGDLQIYGITLSGSATLKEEVRSTLEASFPFTGRCSVRAARITEHDSDFEGTVIDEVRWRDLYSFSVIGNENFGNVTTIRSVTYATASALAVKERRLNMLVTRKIPAVNLSDGTFTEFLYPSNGAADIFCAVCLDPYIGRRRLEELDVVGIYETITDVYNNFGHINAIYFSYTFDSDNMSFEETANAIAEAVFCTAYRRGNVIKWSFEKETDASTLLFNHRNKLPDSETRTTSFGFNNDNDGVEYKYVDPADDSIISVYLPEDTATANAKVIESIGVRNHLQAYFHSWRAWNRIRYQHTTVEFDAAQEADLLVRNDRILNTDGTRPYTQDGEITAVDGLELTLSQNYWETYDITTEDGDDLTTEDGDTLITEGGTHVIWLQHTDGIAESIEITAGSAPNKIVLAHAPRLPLVTDKEMYARTGYVIIGTEDTQETAFLVTEKSASENMTSTVKAVNYDARYYERDTDYINDLITAEGYGPDGGHVSITDPGQGPGSA